jgi:hypothetical protein
MPNRPTSRRQPDLTTAPIPNVLVPLSAAHDAEWCDSGGAFLRFGLRRSMLYALLARGAISGCSLRKRGALKGKRLWNCDSIREFLRRQMEANNEAT